LGRSVITFGEFLGRSAIAFGEFLGRSAIVGRGGGARSLFIDFFFSNQSDRANVTQRDIAL